MARATPEERFWQRVNKVDGECWEWTSYKMDGYGQWHGPNCPTMSAHRFMWTQILGRDVPSGMHFHHKCRNRGCVNPEHLELVTRKEHGARHVEINSVRIRSRRKAYRDKNRKRIRKYYRLWRKGKIASNPEWHTRLLEKASAYYQCTKLAKIGHVSTQFLI